MNRRQLLQLGLPEACVDAALAAIRLRHAVGRVPRRELQALLRAVLATPEDFLTDHHFADLARQLQKEQSASAPISYRTWGAAGIDDQSHAQMKLACELPVARQAALMPDAHLGYGLPIGGVLGCEDAVIPYAVGVDIACRMKLSVLDLPCEVLSTRRDLFRKALSGGTRFGVGVRYDKPQDHSVMDRDWSITAVTRTNKDKAHQQLGTSGSGNHFVEFGILQLTEAFPELNLTAGEYVALLSHSGSRGVGAAVCSTYSQVASQQLARGDRRFGKLAWLSMQSEPGQEYWAAMNLMGEYAAANHAVIHRQVTGLLGAETIAGVENHHNFAWKERHGDRELYVHRKGATPAGLGVLGVIPGSMRDPAFVVRGKGHPESLATAAHGAGRIMSRKQAKRIFHYGTVRQELADQGIDVLSAGADEVPGVYKDIREVMRAQADLVETVAKFVPRIVKMCGDGSRPED